MALRLHLTIIGKCSICSESLKEGEDRALYISECSHAFHYNCILYNALHGNNICPTCNSLWKNLPFLNASPTPYPNNKIHIPNPPPPPNFSPKFPPIRHLPYADDDPLSSSTASSSFPNNNNHIPKPPPPPPPPKFPPIRPLPFADDDPLPSSPATTTASSSFPQLSESDTTLYPTNNVHIHIPKPPPPPPPKFPPIRRISFADDNPLPSSPVTTIASSSFPEHVALRESDTTLYPTNNIHNHIPRPPPPPTFPPIHSYQVLSSTFTTTTTTATTTASSSATPLQQQGANMTVKAFPEYPALGKSEQSNSFAVLVGIQAPPLSPEASDRSTDRAPIDLIAVLDVSGSMTGNKITLLKKAMVFVINNLGPTDRLSIITFSTKARRVTPLWRMTDTRKNDSIHAVNSIVVEEATNIIAGLKMAVQVLDQRREKNPVSSILLLSDGQDNENEPGKHFLRLLPYCIRSNDTDSSNSAHHQTDAVIPVHTFGFGSDHDATTMHAIADISRGTFSYIESIRIIQDAFAQCIGGLLSVVAQQLEIQVETASVKVRIQCIPSGKHRNNIGYSKEHGVIYLDNVYAEEVKQFLVYLSVPPAELGTLTTQLLEVKCLYMDPLSKQNKVSETVKVEIYRPDVEDLSETDRQVCLEVSKEKHRITVAKGIAQAQAMAERGQLHEAQSSLQNQITFLETVRDSGFDAAHCEMLTEEVKVVKQMMASKGVYEGTGRGFTKSMMLCHGYQRAATQQSSKAPAGRSVAMSYQTNNMKKMVSKSRRMRQGDDDQDSIP
ncbi:E3 ubiquitin-protein ligase WAV3-like [Spinacia oleracea]|uniref:E3 ubiquitin-protein ligase WAV3-like n=1 Tax=Spinacia oleracea TaxID=3562 RepID=A0ABM3RTJ2_SPIOL|nr:E3 ubiquitin-protein ligase WAV3-like [Spinacia oleracea]